MATAGFERAHALGVAAQTFEDRLECLLVAILGIADVDAERAFSRRLGQQVAGEEARAGADVDRAAAAVTGDTIAKILFTSGSTGAPKGVLNTHGMLCSAVLEERVVRYDPATNKADNFRRWTGRVNGLAIAKDGSVFGNRERLLPRHPGLFVLAALFVARFIYMGAA